MTMTKTEMQKFLDMQAREGKTKEQALEALMEILSLRWNENSDK